MKSLGALIFAAAVLLGGGCASNGEAKKPEDKPPKLTPDASIPAEREHEARAAAEKMALGMAEALKTGDFEKFSSTQQKGGRRMPPEVFFKLRKSMLQRFGKPIRAEYLGVLDQGPVRDYMWKFIFESKKTSGAPGRHEIVCWVRVGFAGGKPVVAGFSFDLH